MHVFLVMGGGSGENWDVGRIFGDRKSAITEGASSGGPTAGDFLNTVNSAPHDCNKPTAHV